MHQTSPGKGSNVARLGSAIDRNMPSPNARRDPATPSRIVRTTRTPPTSTQLTQLPSLDEGREHLPEIASSPNANTNGVDEVVDEVVTTASMYERKGRSSSTPQEAYDEAFDSDSDTSTTHSAAISPAIGSSTRGGGGSAADEPMVGDAPTVAGTSPVQRSLVAPAAAAGGVPEVKRSAVKRPPFDIRVEKKERIGRGSFGDVFRAIDLDTGNEIAIKEIVVAQDWSKDLEKQIHTLEREIRVMQKLDHPNTVKYLGAKRMSDTLNIYMEYVSGGTVASLLRSKGHFTEEETKSYTKQLLSGLDYLHGKKIAHRDLKGDNMFLTKDGVLKVGDFGTSKELQTMRVTDSVAGTPNFMAPEVIACSGHSFQADIWSVGCCIVQMLTGKPPFSSLDNHMAVMFAVMKGQIDSQIPKDVAPALRDFLGRCFQTDPQDRATTKQLLQHPWITGEEFVPQPTPPPPASSIAAGIGSSGASSSPAPRSTVVPALSPPANTSEASPGRLHTPQGLHAIGSGGGGGVSHAAETPSQAAEHRRSHHPPVIAHRTTLSREGSAGGHPSSSTGSSTPPAATPPAATPSPLSATSPSPTTVPDSRSTSTKSPPPSAGSASNSKVGSAEGRARSHFVSRFPRHNAGDASVQPPLDEELPPVAGAAPSRVGQMPQPLTKSNSGRTNNGKTSARK